MARKLSMSPEAIASRERRAAKKAATRAALASGESQADAPAIEVLASEPEPPKSLKERLFGLVKNDELPKRSAARGSKKENLLVSVLPTVAGSFIATYSAQMLPEMYRECAPDRNEVAAILTPLMAIIGRRVEIVGKASQDAIDMTNALVMALAYGARASVTYMDIKRGLRDENKKAELTGSDGREIRTSERPRAGIDRSRTDRAIAGILDEAAGIPDSGRPNAFNDPGENVGGEADIIADMFRRDRAGRVELGLLPRGIPGTNHTTASTVE